ncbi:peptidogalycan biosysnthesis protein [Nocardia sp. NBC_00565]|uniref:peptidogalycan biosysnthesis protein n=1 Tax=Nocardia sp. NBC_00565 TaxID=2975993 RepID=UPI002E823653|nr:peptidogalycan biosysnthesis protein [Nocardia sp. NBC_00565]WUC00874.1 peptidogalycan biosysnthesis protein [Nocardia sp. NBC_00565]
MLGTSIDMRLVEAVDAISAVEWDALVRPGDLFCSHAWLRHLDLASGPHPVLTISVGNRIAAATVLWDGEQTPGLFHLPDFFPKVSGPWRRPFVWLGARRSVRNGLIGVAGSQRSVVLSHLLTGALDYAREHRRAGVVMPYLPLSAAREFGRAHPDAHVLLHSAEAIVAVPAHGTSDVVAQASGHNRKRRRRELRDFTAAGFTAEWVDLTPDIEAAIAPLIAATRHRFGNGQGVDWMRRVFAAQRRVGLLDHTKVLLCHRAGRPATVAVCYRHGDSLHGRYFGADEALGKDGYAYFVTTCYAPIDYAAHIGAPRLLLATSSLEAKIRRGATVEPLAAVVLLDDAELDIDSVRAHNTDLARGYWDRFTKYESSLSRDWLDFLP